MKSIKKNLIAAIGFSLAAALFFSCDNPVSSQSGSTGGSGGGTVSDGGSGGSGGTGGAGGSGGGSGGSGVGAESGGGSGGAGASGGGTGGAGGAGGAGSSGGAESLPASVGTDPFKGHTYTRTYSNSSSSTSYEFSDDNKLTQTLVKNGTLESGTKWQYTYNANNKEVSLSPVQRYVRDDFSGVYAWRTRDEIAAMYNNYTYQTYVSQYGQTMSESEFNQAIQQVLANNQEFFATVSIYKAEEDFFKNLKLRTEYYKTVPSSLVSSKNLYFSKPGNSNTLDLRFSKNGNYKGEIRRYQSNTQTYYMITDITADTIIAKEATLIAGSGYSLTVGGQELHINYSNLALGDDSNLVITLTPEDSTTTDFFTGLFGNTSVTLSTDTSYSTYIWQDATASTAEYTVPAWPSDAGSDTLNHTYTNFSTTYTFTAGGTLTYEYTYNSNQTRGTKWDYKYNATTKELCLRTSHIKISLGNNSTADWHTYSEIYNYYRTRGYSNDETEAKNYKAQFESLTYYLATPQGATLTIRNNYYKTAPARLPYTTNLNFNKTDTSINKQYYLNVNSEFSNSFGTFQIYPMNQQGSWVPEKSFLISNITENTITAAEATQNNNGTWTPVTGGQQLQLGYTLALGTNNTIAITLTGGDFGTTGVTLNTSYSNMPFTQQQ